MSARVWCVAGLVALSACSGNPTAPVSIATAGVISPANGAQIANRSQPIVLTVVNATTTNSNATLAYTFEVATDTLFTNKVANVSVPQATGTWTSATLPMLTAGTTYYWRVQANGSANGNTTTGVYSGPVAFSVGAAVTIATPQVASPVTGTTTVAGTWPTLTVTDVARTGPASAISYRFDVAANSNFSPVLITGTAAEGQGQTSFTPSGAQAPTSGTFYWRVTALDPNDALTAGPSAVQSFTPVMTLQASLAAQEGLQLWPGVVPNGANGQSVLGGNWGVENLVDFTGVPFTSPLLDALRVFDVMDRGVDPQSALDWINGNGYSDEGAYYPTVAVIGFPQEYMALIGNAWSMVIKVGA